MPARTPHCRLNTVSLLGFYRAWQTSSFKLQSGLVGASMNKALKWRHVHKPIRDFVCSLVVFSALFVVMSPSRHDAAPIIPVLSMFSGATATAAVYHAPPHGTPNTVHNSVMSSPLPAINMPLISTMLALVFSSIMAFNLALLRHLRRVNASSRRGVWKEG